MYKFGKKSKKNLNTCHEDLQIILKEAIKVYDFSVLCGHRGEKEQNEAFANGKSKLKYPKSNHNQLPSNAVDIAPYPIDWKDINRFYELAGIIKGIAHILDIGIIWGGDWKFFKDYPHFERLKK